MKALFRILAFFLILSGCNYSSPGEDEADAVTDESPADPESSVIYDPSGAVWEYWYNQQTEDFEIKKLRTVSEDTLTGEMVENIINNSWPRIQARFDRISNDTVYISIPESMVLTQQMGTTGAMSYMISATFSFTELKGVDYVHFDFEEGDHALPGVYSRELWERMIRPLGD